MLYPLNKKIFWGLVFFVPVTVSAAETHTPLLGANATVQETNDGARLLERGLQSSCLCSQENKACLERMTDSACGARNSAVRKISCLAALCWIGTGVCWPLYINARQHHADSTQWEFFTDLFFWSACAGSAAAIFARTWEACVPSRTTERTNPLIEE